MMTTLKEAAVDLCPAPVELISDPMGGRYVVANKDIERGAVVLVARPYAVGITSEGVCAHCLAEVDIDAAAYTGKRNAAAKKAAAAANGGKNGSRATVPPPSADAVSCAGCGLSYCSKMCYDNHAAYHRGTGHCRVHQLIRACDLATRLDRCDLESVTLIAAMLARAVASGEFQKLVDEKRKQKAEADAAKARSSSSPPASVSATAVNSDPRAPTSVSVKAVAKSDADGEGGEEARRETDESKFVTLTDPSQAAWLASPTSTRFGPIEPTFADVLALVSNVEGMSSSDRKRFDVAFSAYDRTLRMAEARTPIPVWSPLGEVEMVEPTKDAAHTFLPKIGQALFYRLASIDQCNSFGFWHRHPSVSHFCRATATIPAAALFNHSCSPNLVRMNAGASPVFVALHDIKKGTALCISYIDTTQELGDRQDTLQSTYKFGCGCDRCTVETRMMSSIGHLKSDYQPLRSSIIPCASCHNGLLLPADTPIVKTLVGTLPSVVAAAAIGKDQRKALRAAAAAAVARAEAEIEETDDENDANDQDPVSATSKKKAESLEKKAHLPTEFRCSCCFGFASLAL